MYLKKMHRGGRPLSVWLKARWLMLQSNKLRRLSPMQERLYREYIKDLNGSKAAIRAGYSSRAQGFGEPAP
jgi:hypothetical protein